ncbi:MAG: polysaccharide export protein, partial [Nitrospirota bacterium]|nr:polysaccharide export protein [Nitrospirota bacterium]
MQDAAVSSSPPPSASKADEFVRSTYVLGVHDQITVRMTELEETEKNIRIAQDGYINLPTIGRIHAAGLTVEQLEAELVEKLKQFVRKPQVSVEVKEFRSQPVSVIGAVNKPGVRQLEGEKTVVEMLSQAEGLNKDAGHTVKITRRMEWGRLPLTGTKDDPTGQFSVAELDLTSLLAGHNPEQNITVKPHDVISVPRAEMIYVVGEVKKAGGFLLTERQSLSVLQAISLAEGVSSTAAPQRAKILRASAGSPTRTEIAVDVKKILGGRSNDVALQADDNLFIPNHLAKKAAARALEAALQAATYMALR